MTYYHGTSIPGLKIILPPVETRVLREDFRKKFMDCVFVTPSKLSAANYAKKCAAKFGGQPIVYEVRPINPTEINRSQYVCDKAIVLKSYKLK
jgi:hypothetical protein